MLEITSKIKIYITVLVQTWTLRPNQIISHVIVSVTSQPVLQHGATINT